MAEERDNRTGEQRKVNTPPCLGQISKVYDEDCSECHYTAFCVQIALEWRERGMRRC